MLAFLFYFWKEVISMKLKEKLTEQYMTYRDILKETDLVEDVKQTIPFVKEENNSTANKENTRKWHSRLY